MNTKEIEQNIAYHRHTQKPIQLLSKIVRNPLKNLWKTSIDFDKSSKKRGGREKAHMNSKAKQAH